MIKGAVAGAAAIGVPGWFVRDAEAAEAELALQRPRRIGPNDTINIAVIGPGGPKGGFQQGLGVTRWLASKPGTKIVAVCDVDQAHVKNALNIFKEAKGFGDYRELLRQPGIDAVVIGTPDHWHADIAIAAMRAGKDVYCEKPLSLTIAEARLMADAQKRFRRIFQVGSQQRSDGRFRLACELVRNGRIGKIKKVTAHLPQGPVAGPFEIQKPPAELDWNMWLGTTPVVDYCPERGHGSFRYFMEYSGGMLTDWGAHHNDIAQWGLGMDDSGPISVRGTAKNPPDVGTNFFNTFPEYDVIYEYPGGIELLATNKGENGVTFEGEEGTIFVSRGTIRASDQKLLDTPLPANATRLYVSNDHAQNFLDGIRTRKETICPAEVGARSVTVCHLANISLRLGGRKLVWDPKAEQFVGSAEGNALLSRPRRDWTKGL